jgi:hypothetical protein
MTDRSVRRVLHSAILLQGIMAAVLDHSAQLGVANGPERSGIQNWKIRRMKYQPIAGTAEIE